MGVVVLVVLIDLGFLDGCISNLKSFVDILWVACSGLKMNHTWSLFASTDDYLSRFLHMWSMVLTLLASTTSCERDSLLKMILNPLVDVL